MRKMRRAALPMRIRPCSLLTYTNRFRVFSSASPAVIAGGGGEGTSAINILQFPAREDNYGYLIHVESRGEAIAVDAPDAERINDTLAANGWKLTHILNTHHHYDHVEGNKMLKQEHGCEIIGPCSENDIPGLDTCVKGGDSFVIGGITIQVLDTGGHTLDHISFYVPSASAAFVGDTIFALGCGRIFEGTPTMMYDSIQRIKALGNDTKLYCGHNYFSGNAAFALSVDSSNEALVRRVQAFKNPLEGTQSFRDLHGLLSPDITTVKQECATNPFLRCDDMNLRAHLGLGADANPADVFGALRALKDNF